MKLPKEVMVAFFIASILISYVVGPSALMFMIPLAVIIYTLFWMFEHLKTSQQQRKAKPHNLLLKNSIRLKKQRRKTVVSAIRTELDKVHPLPLAVLFGVLIAGAARLQIGVSFPDFILISIISAVWAHKANRPKTDSE